MKIALFSLLICISSTLMSQPIRKSRDVKDARPEQFTVIPRLKDNRVLNALSPTHAIDKAVTSSRVGDKLKIPVTTLLNLDCTVLMKKEHSPHIVVMRLRVLNFDDSEMYVIRRIDNDKPTYFATVINKKYSDALILKGDSFTVEKQNNIISE